MYSARTLYHVAASPAQYRACHEFFRHESKHPLCLQENPGFPTYTHEAITFPTIQAIRDGKVVGVMASRMSPKLGLVASPLHVAYDIKNAIPTVFRLIDCYEYILRNAGLTHYVVISPNFKPAGRRIWEELKQAELCFQALNDRYNVYRVKV